MHCTIGGFKFILLGNFSRDQIDQIIAVGKTITFTFCEMSENVPLSMHMHLKWQVPKNAEFHTEFFEMG
jgi:hypothetical protein